jgi:hypothetical protein
MKKWETTGHFYCVLCQACVWYRNCPELLRTQKVKAKKSVNVSFQDSNEEREKRKRRRDWKKLAVLPQLGQLNNGNGVDD